MPLQATSGAASYDGFGGGVAVVPNYIEDVFSTYLYTGTAVAQTITNNIDLSTKGGMVWTKNRNYGISHGIVDTARGVLNTLITNNTDASASYQTVTAFGTTGFSVGTSAIANGVGDSTMVSWTFREQPKFFDVVTYTGNGVDNRDIAHSLGSTPGCIIVKCTNSTPAWRVFHRSLTAGNNMELNATDGQFADTAIKSCTDTTFRTNSGSNSNGSGNSYIAYLFAHDAGGFGLTGTDNVISCGSYTTDGSGNATINLGYEPQWLLVKNTSAPASWIVVDNMRGFGSATDSTNRLNPNTSGAEITGSTPYYVTSTGFTAESGPSVNFIYIAIRRGPMKVPTLGTSVFSPVINTGTGANTTISSGGFAPDMLWNKTRDHAYGTEVWDKLRGVTKILGTSNTSAEGTSPAGYDLVSFNNTGVTEGVNSGSTMNISGWTYINYLFQRAPGFFDEVCYTGTGSATTVTHNLTVAPQMMIIKRRSSGADWTVYHVAMGANKYTFLDGSTELSSATIWNATTPTASVFSVGPEYYVNYAANTYVAYLFATLAGVSKVGSYTGTGALQTVNCGFTTGARFVLIHRIDSGSNDWFVYDSARGITSGNDPYLALNSTAAEVTSTNYVDTDTTGFKVTAAAPAGLNANGGTFIFLAIA